MKMDILYYIYLEGIGYHTNSPPLMGGETTLTSPPLTGGDRGEGDVIF